MVDWGGRGSGGGPRPIVGRSGFPADEWADFGKEVGSKMRQAHKDGYCAGTNISCQYWGIRERTLKNLEKAWGDVDKEFIKKNSSCCLSPEDWYKYCPVAKKHK